jgi:hypothetical protein
MIRIIYPYVNINWSGTVGMVLVIRNWWLTVTRFESRWNIFKNILNCYVNHFYLLIHSNVKKKYLYFTDSRIICQTGCCDQFKVFQFLKWRISQRNISGKTEFVKYFFKIIFIHGIYFHKICWSCDKNNSKLNYQCIYA